MATDLSHKPRHKPVLKLDWCSHEAAKYAVRHWYYRPEMPSGKTVKIGVWEDGQFVGCVIFGSGANSTLVKPYGLKQTEGCELVRVAMTTHSAPMSRILRVALLFLKQHCPGLRLVVTFADPTHHYGGIYQATNWIYAGETNGDLEYDYHGEHLHGRSVFARFGTKRPDKVPGLIPVRSTPKHRYLFPLDEDMRRCIMPLARPYPKPPRATSIDSDALSDQERDGGARPTVALPSISTPRKEGRNRGKA